MIELGLQEFKDKYKLSDGEIAKYIGVSRQTVRQWRWMKYVPTLNGNHLKLAKMMQDLETSGFTKWYRGQAIDYLQDKRNV